MRRMKNSIILSALQIFAFLFCSMATAAAAVEPANSSAGIPNIFLINLPIVSYYEIGTALTANHGHASMMGVYGMMAIGLALFCLRYIIPEKYWSDKAARISFWSLNLGLAWMVFATLFPLGILQLYHSISVSYYDARTLN